MDHLQEIWASLKQNKFRTILTGFSVAWGIFILIVLLAASTGLKNGIMSNFGSRQLNSVTIWSGQTSIPYQGLKTNRRIQFSQAQVELLRGLPELENLSPSYVRAGLTANYQRNNASLSAKGVEQSYADIVGIKLIEGRFINHLDQHTTAKVAVLDQRSCELLCNGNTNVVGQRIDIGNISYQIIGVVKNESTWTNATLYIPFSTSLAIYNPGGKFSDIIFTLKGVDTEEANTAFEEKLKALMGQSLFFDKADTRAFGFWNILSQYLETVVTLKTLTVFILLIGLLTLISGAVGVSNIMIVSVQERTREIGIRKALGAQPRSVILSIVGESLFITVLFGYVGMMMGIGIIELISNSLNVSNEEMGASVFQNPSVEFIYVYLSNITLIITGIVAGYIPARRAAKIKPIEAMRHE